MALETETERNSRHLREQAAAAIIREELILNERPGERLIRAMLPFNQASGYRPHTFVRADVASVAGVEQDRSALILRSGVEIPVALPYRELEQKIFRPDLQTDGPVLDLCEVTGAAARPKAGLNGPRIWN